MWLDPGMSELTRHNRRWLVAIAALGVTATFACSEDEGEKPESATETNVAPAPCDSDDDCPGRCVLPGEAGASGEELGFCELEQD